MGDELRQSRGGSSKLRIALGVTFTIVFVVAGVVYLLHRHQKGSPQAPNAQIQGSPDISSLPGVGNPSRQYVQQVLKSNERAAQTAKEKGTSAIPTITRSSVVANIHFKAPDADQKKYCSPQAIKRAHAAGVSAAELRCRGCSASELLAAGYTPGELRQAGFNAAQLKAAGASPAALRAAGYAVDVPKACQPAELAKEKKEGLSAAKLKADGCTAAELRKSGYTPAQLKAAGFTAKQLRSAGVTAEQLLKAGFSPTQLEQAGFTHGDLVRAGHEDGLKKNLCSPALLRQERAKGVSAAKLKSEGCSADALKAAGFTPAQLQAAGFGGQTTGVCSPAMLKQAEAQGATVAQLQAKGCTMSQLAAAGIASSPQAQAAAGYDNQFNPNLPTDDSMDPRLAALQRRQAIQLATLQRQQAVDAMQQAMAKQTQAMVSSWSPPPKQTMVESTVKVETHMPKMDHSDSAGAPIVKAGAIMYGVMETSLNSDYQGTPILVKIVHGPFKGGRLLGSFTQVSNRVLLTFKTMSLPKYEKSIPVNIVAIDPETARTAIATSVDNHYMLRYGTLFASSFTSGLANAISSSGSQSSTSNGGTLTTFSSLDTGEKVAVALGSVGTQFSQQMGNLAQTPPTVYVASGAALGLLFMSDLTVPNLTS